MLSTQEIAAHLSHVSYKPGWTWRVYDDPWEGQKIRLTVDVPDSYEPQRNVTLGIDSFLPPMQTSADVERWLMWRICRIESHEAREFVRVDGERPFDPHA